MAAIKKTATRKSATAAKPVATAKPAAAGKTASKAAVTSVTPETVVSPQWVSQLEFKRMVEEAAYYRAEKVGFQGNPEDHWAESEKEVRAQLKRQGIRID